MQGRLNCLISACADGVAASRLKLINSFLVSTIPKASRFAAFFAVRREEMVTTGTFLGSGTKE